MADNRPYAELVEHVRENRALFVVGTGVSLSATKGARTASWTGLIKDGLSYCTALDPKLSSTWAEGKRAGISRITPHGLRHTGNDLLRRFASREVVMSITGHSTPAMHSHYSHVDAGEKAAAVGKVIELVTKRAPSDQQRGEFLDPDKLPCNRLNSGGATQI